MSMKIVATARTVDRFAISIIILATLVAAAALIDDAFAQGNPFGGSRPGAAPVPVGGFVGWLFGGPSACLPTSGIGGWLVAVQSEFSREFSGLIRASKTDGSAAWSLIGVSFLYGIFHAAGPGHGKAVISSYLVANEETWVRGVVLSLLSALMQAAVAVVLVGIAAVALHATAATMNSTVNAIEIVSYELIIWVGARLFVVKGWSFIRALFGIKQGPLQAPTLALLLALIDVAMIRAIAGSIYLSAGGDRFVPYVAFLWVVYAFCAILLGYRAYGLFLVMRSKRRLFSEVGAAVTTAPPAHEHSHDDHNHTHAHHSDCDHDDDHHGHAHHDHKHDDDASAWGHAHAPEPEELAGPGGWRRGLSAILAVGLRPCSGAILVLVFALSQGLFWVGAISTFVMGLGTFITVAVIASLAVSAKSWGSRIASSRSGYGMLAMRGVEVGAAGVVILFGTLLLAGYVPSCERLPGI
jgi:ABC-type nickel/cobalt efflux system permease component RcnA